jgi:hypothetical protein
MSNERLRGAIASAGLTVADVANEVGVSPKSVERWITLGRVPHRTHRVHTTKLLRTDEAYLWPSLADDQQSRSAGRAELVEFYPSRSAVPLDLWTSLPDSASESFDFLAYSGLFLPEYADLVPRLVARARAGVRVRVLIGNPEGQSVLLRSREEGTGAGLAERIRLCLRYLRDAEGVPGFEVRCHDTTLYASIYRADDVALVNTHVYGSVASHNPVLHLRRIPGGRVFDQYLQSFDQVWASASAPPVSHLAGGGDV